MPKLLTTYECQQCGYQSPKWLGRCTDCGSWNSLVEQSIEFPPKSLKQGEIFYSLSSQLTPLDQIQGGSGPARISTSQQELDRLLGGGMVPGSVILLGGDPGIGKSTLVLQLLAQLAQDGKKVAYLSGEESAEQIKLRADRLSVHSSNLFLMTENNLTRALTQVEKLQPALLVVDSIQTVYLPELSSAPGSVTQVRETAGKLLYLAKSKGIILILVGHVTKEGAIAGPKILEHLVDTVLYFEGDRGQPFRMLRTFKNRFGSVSELAVYQMGSEGLQEVLNPSELFLSENPERTPGSVVVSSLKGTRPLLVELQALVTPSNLGMPRRVILGVDAQRVALLVAVLEKVVGLPLHSQDIFLNVVGGLDVDEPSVDLGVILAIASSFKMKPLAKRGLVLGEVGLNGEVRGVAGTLLRLQEAHRLGFRSAMIPKKGVKEKIPEQMDLIQVKRVEEALEWGFG
jgi:DNA repair protein RadA/Sms